MLPNPNLVERLIDQQSQEIERQGWGTTPIPRRAAWRRWIVALAALLFGGL